MKLRPELMPPALDEEKVACLARLAGRLDGARPGECDEELEQFNREAGTAFDYLIFQGIYGSMDHDEWVRGVLVEEGVKVIPGITSAEFLEMIRRVCQSEGEEHETWFWGRLLELNLDPDIVNLIFWPGDYFDDGDDSRDLSPKQILDIALTARRKRQAGEAP
jgi:hypothetical protein